VEKYEGLVLEIITFEQEDVIVTSTGGDAEGAQI
jgi:hypothetical protein